MKVFLTIKSLTYRLLVLLRIIERGEVPPDSYAETTGAWIKQARSLYRDRDFKYQQIHSPHIISRKLPKCINTTVHTQFSVYSSLNFQSPDTFVASIPGGRVYTKDGIVIGPDNMLLWDVSKNFYEHPRDHELFQKKTSKTSF